MKLKNLDKGCKEMSLSEQLFFIETYLPDAWKYLHDTAGLATAVLPKFDNDDEPITRRTILVKVFLNPGHSPNGIPDPGAVNSRLKLRECDIAKKIGDLVEHYLVAAGVDIVDNVQSDDLVGDVVAAANTSGADLFISIHCNSFCNPNTQGTEICVYPGSSVGTALGDCIQAQIVGSVGTVDRGIKYRDDLYVLRATNTPAVLVETAFISNDEDAEKLRDQTDEFARAIARGVTDYICSVDVSNK